MLIHCLKDCACATTKYFQPSSVCPEGYLVHIKKDTELRVHRVLFVEDTFMRLEVSFIKGKIHPKRSYRFSMWAAKANFDLSSIYLHNWHVLTLDQISQIRISNNRGMSLKSLTPPLNRALIEHRVKHKYQIAAFISTILTLTYDLTSMIDERPKVLETKRLGLGNHQEGDQFKYRPRGLLMMKGRDDYESVAAALGVVDIINNPSLILNPMYMCDAAAWYWINLGLNEISLKNSREGLKLILQKLEHPHRIAALLNFYKRSASVLNFQFTP